MRRISGLVIAILFLGFGLVRVGVGGALLAQSMGIVEFTELADAIADVKQFMDSRADEQFVPFSVRGYFAFIIVMGALLATGAVGAISRKWWGQALLGVYLALHAALFINFQEINPKIVGLALQVVMLLALVRLRPPGLRGHAVST